MPYTSLKKHDGHGRKKPESVLLFRDVSVLFVVLRSVAIRRITLTIRRITLMLCAMTNTSIVLTNSN